MRVFLTGGTGFVGSWVAARLLSEGHTVVILARDPGKVPGLVDRAGVEFVHGSMTSADAIARGLRNADACIHVALGRGDGAVGTATAETLPTIALFEAAADAGVERIVYTSSVAVFDEPIEAFDDGSPPRPARYYGATKTAAEAYLVALGATRGVAANSVRPGYTFGNPAFEGAPTQSMPELPALVRAAVRGDTIEVVREDGLQFIWAGDLARVFSAVLSSERDREYFTALSPDFITWEQMARLVVQTLGSRSDIRVVDRGLPPARPHYSVEAIEQAFGLRFDARQHLPAHLRYLAETVA